MLDQVTGYLSNVLITDVSHIDSDITLKLGEIKLWVHTSWRLEKEGRIVIGNDNLVELLYHEDYKFDYDASKVFIKDCLKGATIIDVKYSDFNELILLISNGFTFRSFQTNGDEEDDADNFQLYLSKQRFLVYPTKVELEDLGQFYRG
ncbi:MAG: hypothetical protein DWQ02_23765 [Bacteroidetes bacterium]|nr:MAG: hypothetical protein DWQ02_23765 [Bacteroidota bacterium]